MQLYLIRHPQPAVAAGICYGASDVPLADEALPSLATLRRLLPPLAPVFSSPLRRCATLAEALHVAPAIDARLSEISFGEWEMRHWDEIGRQSIDAWAAAPLDFAPPGGEAPRAVLGRALDWLTTVFDAGLPRVVAVTHAGVIRLLSGYLQGLPESDWLDLRFAYGSVTAFDVADVACGGGRRRFLEH